MTLTQSTRDKLVSVGTLRVIAALAAHGLQRQVIAGLSPLSPRQDTLVGDAAKTIDACATGSVLVMAGSGVIKTIYSLLLQRGYRSGDFSLIYPLARGTGFVTTSFSTSETDRGGLHSIWAGNIIPSVTTMYRYFPDLGGGTASCLRSHPSASASACFETGRSANRPKPWGAPG